MVRYCFPSKSKCNFFWDGVRFQGKITSLSNQLEVERTAKKRMKIEQEKEIRDYQSEKNALETKNRDLMDKLRRLEHTVKEAEENASNAVAVI